MTRPIIIASDRARTTRTDILARSSVQRQTRFKVPKIDVDTASRDRLIRHIDELEFIIDDLLPRRKERTCETLGLTPQQSDILDALLTGRTCSRTYLARVSNIPDPSSINRQVDVQLNRIRSKLACLGVEIINTHGVGWHLGASDIQRLNSIIDGEG